MTDLAKASVVLGGALAPVYTLLVLAPARMREWLVAFPRNKWAGRILALGGLIWTEYLFLTIPLGQFERARPGLCIMVPVALVLIVKFMDDLLAPRALGGLLLLIPAPLLSVARWHESPWRLVIVVVAYVMVIKGIVLVLSPYMFRRAVDFGLRSDCACRAWGVVGLALSCLIVVLGLMVF